MCIYIFFISVWKLDIALQQTYIAQRTPAYKNREVFHLNVKYTKPSDTKEVLV